MADNAMDRGALATCNVTGWANSSIFQKLSVDAIDSSGLAPPGPLLAAPRPEPAVAS